MMRPDLLKAWLDASSQVGIAAIANLCTVTVIPVTVIRSYAREYPNPDYEKYIKSPFSAIIISGREPPETLFRLGIVLEVLNNRDIPVYKLENKAGLSDLLETASYSNYGNYGDSAPFPFSASLVADPGALA